MGLHDRLHNRLHGSKLAPSTAAEVAVSADHDAHSHGNPGQNHGEAAPFWVRNYDRLALVVSLGRTTRLHNATLDLAGFKAGQSLLDVGCGTGELLRIAADRSAGAGELFGLDVEPAMISQAQAKASKMSTNVTFTEGSIDALPHPERTFDVVVSSLMFHHLSASEQAAGLTQIRRVLKPGGTLLVADINPDRRSIVSSLPGHGARDDREAVQAVTQRQLASAGFIDVIGGDHAQKTLYFARGRTP